MVDSLKTLVSNYLLKKGVMLQRATEKSEVVQLIEKLYPVRTDLGLIRLGPNGDGGYLVPDDLKEIEACFSPGVDRISEFELDCVRKYNMKIFMADKSVEKPNLDLPEEEYGFIKKFIGCTSDADFITLDEWIKASKVAETTDLLLQMDIEGSEYHSIINMSPTLINRFRIMVIEFHSLHYLWNPYFFDKAKTVFEKILQTHYCVHIHPNNCCGIDDKFGIEIPRVAEITFLRKDRVKNKSYANQFPHPLDFDNTENEPIQLSTDWYKSS